MTLDTIVAETDSDPTIQQRAERAIEILREALSGESGKSKNTLIKEAISILK